MEQGLLDPGDMAVDAALGGTFAVGAKAVGSVANAVKKWWTNRSQTTDLIPYDPEMAAWLKNGFGSNRARDTARSIDDSEIWSIVDDVIKKIDDGGPFAYPEYDGTIFKNKEGILPPKPPGYYREYTVQFLDMAWRSGKRLVEGAFGELYLTLDHYESFIRIR